jgi:hypothetical protein
LIVWAAALDVMRRRHNAPIAKHNDPAKCFALFVPLCA